MSLLSRSVATGTFLLALFAVIGQAAPPSRTPRPASSAPGGLFFTDNPKDVALNGAFDSSRILVEERGVGGLRDVSDTAQISVADPKVAIIDHGVLWPRGDGATVVVARLGTRTVRLPVTVRGVTAGAAAPRFVTQVLPVLTRAGCNQGACHGAASGKGGFKLSLQGFDPDADYDAITRAVGARRVTPARPEQSLLLRKPSGALPHRGGVLFAPGSPAYRLLTAWIGGGMPAPRADEPSVTALEIVPPTRTLPMGATQRFRVYARLSDNTRRDVSADTLFSASDGAVASVAPDGLATIVGRGEASVLIRYRDRVATASLISPYTPPLPAPVKTAAAASGPARLDYVVDQKLAALGLESSPICSDSDFLRRVTLDLIGELPSPDDARAFLADNDPNKRSELVENLLARPEFVDYWTLQWGDLLRSSRTALGDRGLYAMNAWIRQSVASNKPWNQWARELILARGSAFDDGPANFFRAATTPETQAETTSQVFMGVRMQCARCHNHPYEKWRQSQYYELAAFFARVRTKAGEAPDERIVYTDAGGDIRHPKTGKVMLATPLDGAPLPANFTGDRRAALADWLTTPKNPFFARILVNRMWRHFFGAGLVEPVDDLRVTNPASNPALLDALASEFVAHGYDLKYLMRTIVATRAYQRSAMPARGNGADSRHFAHFPFKRLGAEPLLDAIASATGVADKFGGYPSGLRASQLPDTLTSSYFLDLFGRPARNIVCACERSDDPNLGQVLHIMNGKEINDKIGSGSGRIARLIASKATDPALVEELYLAAYARYPTDDERWIAAWDLTHAKDRKTSAEDLLWALLNSKEFLFNH